MNETANHNTPDSQDQFDARLQKTLLSITAPAGLQERLLGIPDLPLAQARPDEQEAANDSPFWHRLLPAAAALLLAIGIGLYYEPDLNAALANEVFGHIYREEPSFGGGSELSTAELNARLLPVTGEALDPEDSALLHVTFAKDCYIASQRTMHLVVKGETGPVNVMMIPGRVVESEMKIADQRFHGLVSPAPGGTLVVVGNKQEPISATRDRVASSLHWDY